MATEPNPGNKQLIEPKQVNAWITLGGTIFGLLSGLAKATGSIYNPIDTVLIYISLLTFMLYGVTFAAALLVGLSTLVFGEAYLNSPVALVLIGVFIAVVAIPAGLSSATGMVSNNPPLDAIGITFMRFVGVSVIVLAAWLMYKYGLVPRNKDKSK